MENKGNKRSFKAVWIVFTLACFLAILSIYGLGQAASAAAGLERHQKAGLTCQSCHKESPPKETVPSAQCMICHGNLAKLIEKSSKAVPNPHASPHLNPGEQPQCEECHHMHKASEVTCNVCHKDFKFNMP